MEFLIGFEFEFGWEPGFDAKKPKGSKYIPKITYFENFIYVDVKNSLKKFLGSQYKFIAEITDDPSISFNKNFRNGHFGVEVVTKPLEEILAIEIFSKILDWMRTTHNIITNNTCALHVNISVKDKKINNRIDYFSVITNTPQNRILRQYGRLGNVYCQATSKRKFSLQINKRRTVLKSFDRWIKRLDKDYIYVTTYQFSNFKLDGEKKISKIYFDNKSESYEMIKEAFINSLRNVDKNIAVVEKKSPTNQKYFEFRMIGNTDYEYKEQHIYKCIAIFKNAIKKSII